MKREIYVEKIKELTRKKFVRNVFTVASGTVVAQGIAMAFSPIITRMYGPEAFGVLGVFISLISIVTPIAALTFPIAIVLPKSDVQAKGLVRLSIYVTFLMSAITTVIIVLFKNPVVKIFQIEELSPYLLFIPMVMAFAAGLQITQQWLLRKRLFAVRAKTDVINSLVLGVSKVCAGLFHPLAATLIIITTAGYAFHTAILMWGTKRSLVNEIPTKEKEQEQEHEQTPKLIALAKKYFDFPLFRAPETFINALSLSLPVLMLTTFFGPAAAGFYTLGKKVLGLPAQIVGKAVGDVFYPRIIEASHKKEGITNLLLKATLSMAAVGVIPFGLIFVFGPWLFGIVFGSQWVVAGEYARWISLWSYFGFINNPSVKSLPVLNAQHFLLGFSIVSIIVRVLALGIGGIVLESDIAAIILFAISGAITNMILISLTINKSRRFDASRL